MSALEVVVAACAIAVVLVQHLPARPRRGGTTAVAVVVAGAVASGAALLVLDVRWQLVPVLVGAAIAVPFAARVPGRPVGGRRWVAAVASVASLGLIASGIAAACAFPIPVFPPPTGPYAVGSTVLEWTDADRPEPATADPDDRRTIVAQLWYPAQAASPDVERARYLGRTEEEAHAVAEALADQFGAPGFLLGSAARARTNAVPDAPPASDGRRFPLVLFSPAIRGVRTQNTAWAEELASRGYVVAALDHPHDSAVVAMADGRLVHTQVFATSDPAVEARMTADLTATRVADLRSALTRLAAGPFSGLLDVGRVAVAGHSFGGAAALQAARADPRISAAIDLDGGPREPGSHPFPQPALAITSLAYYDQPTYAANLDRVLDLSEAVSYRLTVPGSGHLSSTDAPLYLPPVLPEMFGSLGRTAGTRIAADASALFLDHVLGPGSPDPAPLLARYGDLHVHDR